MVKSAQGGGKQALLKLEVSDIHHGTKNKAL